MAQGKQAGENGQASRKGADTRIRQCKQLAIDCARLTKELDRIEDSKGVGAQYYAKLDESTETRQELGKALSKFLIARDRESLGTLRQQLAGEAGALRALDQAIGDQIAQYIDDALVRHELFVVPVLLPQAFRATELAPEIRELLQDAWRRLADNRDYPDDAVKVEVSRTLYSPANVYERDEVDLFWWNAGPGNDAPLVDEEEAEIEHWDETPMSLRFLVIRVATAPEFIDEGEEMAADDLRPYLPNFAEVPKSYLTWSADARKALSRITRGHINVGFPDDALAARTTGRYFTQFWLASFSLHAQLKALDAEDDLAEIAVSLHNLTQAGQGKTRLVARISLLDDDGDLLAGHPIDLDAAFSLDVAQPLVTDLALALSIDQQSTVPGIHSLADDRADDPLFHSKSGWKRLSDVA